MPKCTINGQTLEVKDGTTIIEAMNTNSQRIAHYCWHPGLSIAGVCRLCMVEIEGNPRLQIACNTVVTEGMAINNQSPKVRDAVKWGLDFHLINHPLDCPICDQAGECGLQDQFMEYGKYDPEMAERKVKKRKVVDLGPKIVLDTERCILCSRCVRFTDEVTKTQELGIFNRGDRSEIGTFDDKPLNNKYSVNVVDICPVGALTSRDFRFKQRVWYLKEGTSVCPGCSTGCSVKVFFNKEGLFRVKPAYNPDVNGYWMCDEGRETYKFVNRDFRLLRAKRTNDGQTWSEMLPGAAAKELLPVMKQSSGKAALILTAQYTVEELEALVSSFTKKFGSQKIYHWVNNKESFESFDGLLLRGDKNPNTKGLLKVLEKNGISVTWADLEKDLRAGSIDTVVVAGPENQFVYPDLADKVALLKGVKNLIWFSACPVEALQTRQKATWIIPMKTYVEKDGTFINAQGKEQKIKRVTTVVSEALTLVEATRLMSGDELLLRPQGETFVEAQKPVDRVTLEQRKKNEFVFRRGAL